MDRIKQIVDKLVRKYKTNDPFEIADFKGIIILREPLGSTLGYHSSYRRHRFIHINSDSNKMDQLFTCAHELAHDILHPRANTPFLRANTLFSIDRIEHEANRFAVELLLPDWILRQYMNTACTIEEIASTRGVPSELARLKRFTK
ncbi:MAG: ImmA/IrrE family metallo-endopeptidase [Desulfosporosinus sp.]|nr:ImmA/IrrE family metallo-endopeptidase [Desulfosporosinus sp.]